MEPGRARPARTRVRAPIHHLSSADSRVEFRFGKLVGIEPQGLAVLPPWFAHRRLELRRIEIEMKKAETCNGVMPVSAYAGAPIPFFNASK